MGDTKESGADAGKQKEMALSIPEFLRRFELHILPKRFVKIRHYGLLQNHGKIKRLNAVREQLKIGPLTVKVQIPVSHRMLEKYGKDITLCPKCNRGKLVLICTSYQDQNKQTRLKRKEIVTALPEASSGNAPP